MDLDGDGTVDVLSGSWPGELYFFKGLGKGKYAAGQTLKDKAGKVINAGSASTVFAADWRGKGRLDLLVGCIEGHVWLVPNEAANGKPAYGKPVKLSAAGREIRVAHGDSHPVMADWEGSGKPGLVVGCGDGSVLWLRNEGTRSEPKLAAAVTLVPAAEQTDPRKAKQAKGPVRGTRAKVWVCDWNGDNRLDLLVGDFSYSYGMEPKLTEADRKRKKELEAKEAEIERELEPYFKAITKLIEQGDRKTREGRAELEKQVGKIAEKFKKQMEEQNRVYKELRKFQRPMRYHGYVWLYLRKPPQAAAAR